MFCFPHPTEEWTGLLGDICCVGIWLAHTSGRKRYTQEHFQKSVWSMYIISFVNWLFIFLEFTYNNRFDMTRCLSSSAFEDKIISKLFLLLITNPVRTDFCTAWGSRAEENYMLNIESDGRILFRCAVKSCTKTIANKVTSLMRKKGSFAQFSKNLIESKFVVIILNWIAFQ